jgi:Xaa-Pro aminopeptidase
MFRRCIWTLSLLVLCPSPLCAQTPPHQTDFPPDEFQTRWTTIFDRIGDHGVAMIQGATKTNGFLVPRQSNEFYYLCGIETPHGYLILDGKSRQATVVLPPRDARLESAEGKVLSSNDAELVKQITGAAAVLSSKEMTEEWMRQVAGGAGTIIYTPFAPAEGNGQSRGELQSANTAITSDPWDGRPSREAHFQALLKSRFPGTEIRNLTPILDELRAVKSPREIALIRRASELAGRGLILEYRNAIMKRLRPGVTPRAIRDEAKAAMEEVFKRTRFSKPIYERAAHRLVDSGGGVFSHPVGMAVHDDGSYSRGVLKPGHVFSIDPQLRVPEETLYYRYEDVVVITETGYENFTDFLPTQLDEIEKLVGHDGIVQKLK